jgi:hypothetical protein
MFIKHTFNQYHVVKYLQSHLVNRSFLINSSILLQFVDQQQINDDCVRLIKCSIGKFLISLKSDQLYGRLRRTLLFIHGGSSTINEYFVPSFLKVNIYFFYLQKKIFLTIYK